MAELSTFLLRLEPEMMDKLRVLAKQNKRSINKELEFLVAKHVETYEKEHGAIAVVKE